MKELIASLIFRTFTSMLYNVERTSLFDYRGRIDFCLFHKIVGNNVKIGLPAVPVEIREVNRILTRRT